MSKPVLRAVVKRTFEPAHEEFFRPAKDLYYSIEYPDRVKLEIVGFEEIKDDGQA